MNNKRSFEFDAFGPWIYLIEGPHKLPPLFADYKELLLGAKMSFKVPRSIERQKANPEMNLYDLVVGIFEKKIIIIVRKNRGQNEFSEITTIDMSRVTSIQKKNCLLNGQLILITNEKPVVIRYNTLSNDIIDSAITLIRGLIPQKEMDLELDSLKYSRETMALKFVNAVNTICLIDKSLKLVAYQPDLSINIPREFRWKSFSLLGFTEHILSSFVILNNSREIVIIFCHYYPKRASAEAYAYYSYFLPFSTLENITLRSMPSGEKDLFIKSNQMELILPVDSENRELYNFVEKSGII